MKIRPKYVNEYTGEEFDTEAECAESEKLHLEWVENQKKKQEQKKKLEAERKARLEEIQTKISELTNLAESYVHDYSTPDTTLNGLFNYIMDFILI